MKGIIQGDTRKKGDKPPKVRGTKRALALMAVTTLVGCSGRLLPAGTPTAAHALRLAHTPATASLVSDLTSHYAEQVPEIVFEAFSDSHTALFNRLNDNDLSYFISNHLPRGDHLWAAPLAQDGLALVVHPDNPLDTITTQQIRQIYQGLQRHWQGLASHPYGISVYSREDGSGTRAEFERLVMGQLRTTPNALVAPSSEAVLVSVAQQPGGIGYVPFSALDERVKVVAVEGVMPSQEAIAENRYPLRSTLFIIGRQAPTVSPGERPETTLRAFIGWVQSGAGQQVVAQGYAPLPR